MEIQDFCSRYFVERRGTNTLKWDSLQEIFGDSELTALWVADMEFQTPPGVVEAIQNRARHGVFGYGSMPKGYIEAFDAWQWHYHQMHVKEEELRFYTGVVGSLYAQVNTFTQPGDAVIICPPVYYPFYSAVLETSRKLVLCDLLLKDGRYFMDFDRFEAEIKQHGVKMFILCSPHNPVSRVWSEQELHTMFDICARHGVLIVSDEIHQDFAQGEHKFVPASVVSDGAYREQLITLNSVSKTFNLAGMIHSHTLLHSKPLQQRYDAYIKTIGQPEANVFGYLTAEAAYRTGHEWLSGLKAVILSNYRLLQTAFLQALPEIMVTPLEATYLAWIDLRAYLNPDEVEVFMKEQCRLAVDVGEWFSENAKGFIRINLATHPDQIEKAVNNITCAIQSRS